MAATVNRPHPSPSSAAPNPHSASIPFSYARGAGVVLCHPHPYLGGHRDNPLMRNLARRLARDGVVVLRFDFRGVGDSGGKRTWMRDGETDDVVAAARRLSETHGVDPRRVYVCGYSFGSAVALSALDESDAIRGFASVSHPWGARSMLVPARGKSSSAKPKLFLVATNDVVRAGDARSARARRRAPRAARDGCRGGCRSRVAGPAPRVARRALVVDRQARRRPSRRRDRHPHVTIGVDAVHARVHRARRGPQTRVGFGIGIRDGEGIGVGDAPRTAHRKTTTRSCVDWRRKSRSRDCVSAGSPGAPPGRVPARARGARRG